MRLHRVPPAFLAPAMIAGVHRRGRRALGSGTSPSTGRPGGHWWAWTVSPGTAPLLGGFVAILARLPWQQRPSRAVVQPPGPAVALGYGHRPRRAACSPATETTAGPATCRGRWAFRTASCRRPRASPSTRRRSTSRSRCWSIFVVLYRMAGRPQPGWRRRRVVPRASDGVERFLVEFLRINPPWFAGLTEAQWVALAPRIGLVSLVDHGRSPPASARPPDALRSPVAYAF